MSVAQEERQVAISVPKDKSEVVASYVPVDFGTPTGREEDWRFTPIKRLRPLLTAEAAEGQLGVNVVSGADYVSEVAVDPTDVADIGLVPVDVVSALAWQGAQRATRVDIPRGVALHEPVVIELVGSVNSNQRLHINAGADSEGSIVLVYRGSGTHRGNLDVVVGDRANLRMVIVADWDRDAVQVGRIHANVGRDASLHQVVATFGGDLVRLVSTVDYAGPGGSAQMLGAFFANAGQHLEHRLFVDHNQPHCSSNVVYKGVLQGEHAHSVWIGDVLIRAHAVGTDTYEINRNLVLTDGARADSVPNLEIETGEVSGAGHASATGRFDDEQLFYLQARGIAADQARRMVVQGFFTEVLDQIPAADIREQLWRRVDAALGGLDSVDDGDQVAVDEADVS